MPVGAAIGIVRGIASGWRDPEGTSSATAFIDPAGYLADTLERGDAALSHLGGGGRLPAGAARDFRWGTRRRPSSARGRGWTCPPPCGSTRSSGASRAREHMADVSAGASDLVGRDAEKADLHAAYHHQAVNGNGGRGVVTPRAIVGELGIGKTR